MTISDTERRGVARRLRGLEKIVYDPENTYELLADALGVDDFEGTDELFNRLADLIDPSEPEGTCGNCKHFIKDRFMPCDAAHGYTEADVSACEDFSPLSCDRDALLALADEMERVRSKCDFCIKKGDCDWSDETICLESRIDDYAQCIREALGVSDD